MPPGQKLAGGKSRRNEEPGRGFSGLRRPGYPRPAGP